IYGKANSRSRNTCAGGHFTSSRTCGMMLTRAVSEGDAARPITASQPPGRACKTSKHYRPRSRGPLFFKAVHSQIAMVRRSLADVWLCAESADEVVGPPRTRRGRTQSQVPHDDAWLHASRSVTQRLGAKKDQDA